MFNAIARPFGVLLMLLYDFIGNYGLAVILFAVIIKVILLPFQMKSKRSTMQTSRLQPMMRELQKKHGANKQKLNEETAKLYKEEGINPASGCVWSILPFPILIALFYVIRQPLTLMMGIDPALLVAPVLDEIGNITQAGGAIWNLLPEYLKKGGFYDEVAQAQYIGANFEMFAGFAADGLRHVDFNFLGMDLGTTPQWTFLWAAEKAHGVALFFIPFLSGGTQFLLTKISQKMNPMGTPEAQMGSMKTMMLMMPLFSVYIAFIAPAALGFYWTFSTILQIAQEIWLTKRYRKVMDAEEAERNKLRAQREEELEQKRLETERKKAEGTFEQDKNTSKRKKQMSEKQEQIEKTSEWQRKHAPPAKTVDAASEPSRSGSRSYARGRAYDPDRFAGAGGPPDEAAPAGESPEEPDAENAEDEIERSVGEEADEFDASDEEPAEEESADDGRFETEKFDEGQ